MKILLVANSQPPITGAVVANRVLMRELSLIDNCKVKTLELSLPKRKGFIGINALTHYLILYVTIRKLKNSHQIIYTPSSSKLSLIRDIVLLPTRSKKLFLYYHNRGLEQIGWRLFKKMLNSKTYDLILLSTSLKCEYKSILPIKGEVHYLPNTINDILSVEKCDLKSDKLTILFLSNFIETKGVADFLSLLNYLDTRFYRIVMIGRDYDYTAENLLSVLSRDFGKLEVLHVGEAYDSNKQELLQLSDIMFFPSTYPLECFPVSVLEAMNSRNYIISYDIGATTEMLGGTGAIVKSSQEAAEVISHFKDSRSQLEREKDRVQSRFYKNYSIHQYRKNLTRIFNND